MLSAVLATGLLTGSGTGNGTDDAGSVAGPGADALVSGGADGGGFGVAALAAQSPHERAYAPLPDAAGRLVHDPDFALPTTAGPLPWRLFHYSEHTDVDGPFGRGRRASWPLRLCARRLPEDGPVLTVTLEQEDGLGATWVSEDGGQTYAPRTPRVFDALEGSPATGFVRRDFETGTEYHFPAGGFASLTYFETPFGQRVDFEYDADQRLRFIRDPAGREIEYRYRPDGYVGEVADWAGRVHTFDYVAAAVSGPDPVSDLRAVWDPGGYRTTFAYDGAGRLESVLDPNGHATVFSYDGNGRVASRAVGGGPPGVYAYAENNAYGGRTVEYRDPYGHAWTTMLDPYGNVRRSVDPVGAERTALYSPDGLPVRIEDAAGGVTELEYDANGRETRRREPREGDYVRAYDPDFGNLLSETDPFGRTTTYTYVSALPGAFPTDPAQRRAATRQDPLGFVTTYTYTAWGALRTVQTPLGYVTTYEWDDQEAVLLSETDPRGGERRYAHDAAGNVLVETDEEGRRATYAYDGLGRQVTSLDGAGAVRTTLYDGVGNLAVSVDPLGNTTTYAYGPYRNLVEEWDAAGYRHTTVYDHKGRETARVDPLGHRTETAYDPADRAVARVDALGRRTTTAYDLSRRPVGVQDPAGLWHLTAYDLADPATGLPAVAQIAPTGHRTTSVYDAAGRLAATLDTAGLRTTFAYDPLGRLEATVEPTGARTRTVHDPDGRSVAVVDAYGHRATSVYDPAGNLTLSIDAEGKRYTTAYDRSGLRTFEQAPDGTFVTREYDGAGRNWRTVDHLGRVTTTGYDPAGRVESFADPFGGTVADEYDALGRPVASRDALGNRSTTTYNGRGEPYLFRSGAGNVSLLEYDPTGAVRRYVADDGLPETEREYEEYFYDPAGRFTGSANAYGDATGIGYDAFGRLAAESNGVGDTTAFGYDAFGRWAVTVYDGRYRVTAQFDRFGRLNGYTDEDGRTFLRELDLLDRAVAEIDPFGYRTSYGYDALGRVTERTDADGAVSTTVYDRTTGRTRAQADALGYRTTFHYDRYGRMEATEDPLGRRTTTVYDPLGRTWATVNARGYATTTAYDGLGRFWATEDAYGYRTTTHYDRFGRAEAGEDPLGRRTTTLYDGRGRVVGTQDAAGWVSTTVYDRAGRAWASVDPLGRRTTTVYDAAGRVWATEDALGYRTTNGYDGRGNLVTVMDARGSVTTYGYDAAGRQASVTDPLGFVTSYAYDRLGRQTAVTDALGFVSTTAYDPLGRVTARTDALGYATSYAYDILGRQTAVTDPLGRAVTTAYDPLGRAVARVDALGRAVTTAYDEVGNRVAVTDPLGHTASHAYDRLDRRVVRIDPLGRRHTFAYDPAGQLVGGTDPLGRAVTYGYDARGLETERLYADPALRLSFSYDAAGQRTAARDATGLTTYAYDALGRLAAVLGPDHPRGWPVSYLYDPAGNRAGMLLADPRSPDGGPPVAARFSYAYDGRGSLTGLTDPDGVPTSFAYDALGRRVRRDGPLGTAASFAYDALGRTAAIRHYGADGTEIERALYVYDAAGRPVRKETLPRSLEGPPAPPSPPLLVAARTVATEFADLAVQPGGEYVYRVSALNAAGAGTPVETSAVPAATLLGLLAEYYNGQNFDLPALTRLDLAVDFNWGSGSPAPLVNADNFCARWSGTAVPQNSGSYTFVVEGRDGARLWVDGILVINQENNTGALRATSAPVALAAGQPCTVLLAYYAKTGDAAISLRWSGPGLVEQAIPSARLRPAAPTTAAALPPAPFGLAAEARSAGRVELRWALWEAAAANQVRVERRPDAPANAAWQQIAALPGDALAYTDADAALAAGTAYRYRLRVARPTTPPDYLPYSVYTPEVMATTLPAAAVNGAGDGASPVIQGVPVYVQTGGSLSVAVTLRNTGTTTWTAADYRLGWAGGATNPWGVGSVALPAGASPVPPGGEATFAFAVTVPAAAGTYPFQWRMERVSGGGATPFGESTAMTRVTAGAAAPAAATGLLAEYFNVAAPFPPSADAMARPAVARLDATPAFSLGVTTPDPLVPGPRFAARWSGKVVPEVSGSYRFNGSVNGTARILVNDQLVWDVWGISIGQVGAPLTLVAGQEYEYRVEYFGPAPHGSFTPRWAIDGGATVVIPPSCFRPAAAAPPAPAPLSAVSAVQTAADLVPRGLLAEYFNDQALTPAAAALTRVEDVLNWRWEGAAPAPGVNADNFSVRWSGRVIPRVSLNYNFTLGYTGGVRLWVNNVLIHDDWTPGTNRGGNPVIALTAGQPTDFRLEYRDLPGANIYLSVGWMSPADPHAPIPASRMRAAEPGAGTLPPAPPATASLPGAVRNVVTWQPRADAVAYRVERSAVASPAGGGGFLYGGVVTYRYDAADRLVSEEATVPTGASVPPWVRALARVTYAYDAAGRRTGRADGAGEVTTYAYDAADQLLWARTGAAFTTFAYDAAGQRTGQTAPSGERTTFQWSAAGRLAGIAPPASQAGGGGVHTFTYGHDGLRRGHQGPGASDADALLWDENAALSDPLAWLGRGGEASPLRSLFVQEPGAGEAEPHLLRAIGLSRQGTAFSHTYFADTQGTTLRRDGSAGGGGTGGTGSGPVTFTYDAWGNRLSPGTQGGAGSGSGASEEPFLFGGGLGYWSEPGLTYVRERWLDTRTGQWLSVDSVEDEPRYVYAASSPSAMVDTFGASPSPPSNKAQPSSSSTSATDIGVGYASREALPTDVFSPPFHKERPLGTGIDFVAGWGDTVSFGVSGLIRGIVYEVFTAFGNDLHEAAGGGELSDVLQQDSYAYYGGVAIGTMHSTALGKAAFARPYVPPVAVPRPSGNAFSLLASQSGRAYLTQSIATGSARAYNAARVGRLFVRVSSVAGIATSGYHFASGNWTWLDLLTFAPLAGKWINYSRIRILDVPAGPSATNLDVFGKIDRIDVQNHGNHVSMVFDATVAQNYKNIPAGTYDFIFVNNPKGMRTNPEVHSEWARVLKPGGQIIIQGSPANAEFRPFVSGVEAGRAAQYKLPRGIAREVIYDRSAPVMTDSNGKPILDNRGRPLRIGQPRTIGGPYYMTSRNQGRLQRVYPSHIVIWTKSSASTDAGLLGTGTSKPDVVRRFFGGR